MTFLATRRMLLYVIIAILYNAIYYWYNVASLKLAAQTADDER